MEVSDYLRRIGVEERPGHSLEVLRRLHERHLLSVPFENLDIHRGVPIVLEPERILEKIVHSRRGGFCYELNYAFHWLLSNLGFTVTLLSAEVARPDGSFGIPFDHMTLLVAVDGGSWLADVGFGESFRLPLRLEVGSLHEEPDFKYRLTRFGEHWHLERGPEFGAQYRFTLAPRALSDYRDACQYHQTSPESTFTQKVVATRALADGRITLTRDRLVVRRGGDRSETAVPDAAHWHRALDEHFGIVLERSSCNARP